MILRVFLVMSGLLFLNGCTGMKPSDFATHQPAFVLESYFSGKTRAWGMFEDRFGTVRRQFVVDIEGRWDGEELTLDESFTFDDGERSTRQWRIRKIAEDRYEGRADDVVGAAIGVVAGNALNWSYVLDLKTGDDSTLRVRFDDWMFLQPGGVLLNRARMSKFGIELGQVTIAFQKVEQATAAIPGVTARQSSDASISAATQ